MAHNFKLTGNVYVSVDGNDSNNGLTKDTPKRTVQAGFNVLGAGQTLIIGAGVYKETIVTTDKAGSLTIRGDGYVVLEGAGSSYAVWNGGQGNLYTFNGIEFRNYTWVFGYPFSYGTTGQVYNNCIFKGINVVGGSTINYTSSIIINCNITSLSTALVQFNKSIIVNSKIGFYQLNDTPGYVVGYSGKMNLATNSYFTNCALNCSISAVNFNYNNIQNTSIILDTASTVTTGVYQDIYGRYYDLSITTSTGDGTVGNPYGRPYTAGSAFSFTNHRILYPTFNANSFSSDPKFNDILAQDFTLQSTSPHIGKASDSSNIGGTNYALRYSSKGAEFNTSAVSVTGLAFVGNDWTISGGTTGEVVSAPILISATAKVLQKISYNGLLEFNKSITGGTAGNRNVPDQEVYDSTAQPPNVAGANPDRLVYYMRYSTQTSQPSADAQWDNGGYWTAGTYGVFEWNTKPTIDNAFLGNGHPSFNSGVTATSLNVTWIQLKVKLRNDYV